VRGAAGIAVGCVRAATGHALAPPTLAWVASHRPRWSRLSRHSVPRVAAHVWAASISGLDHMGLRWLANGTGCGLLAVAYVRLHGCEELICATWWMLKQTKYVAGAGVLTALGAIAPLWMWFQGDLLGAAIIAIPSALVLAIGFGVTWTFLQE
jgi:hypothetical protein